MKTLFCYFDQWNDCIIMALSHIKKILIVDVTEFYCKNNEFVYRFVNYRAKDCTIWNLKKNIVV